MTSPNPKIIKELAPYMNLGLQMAITICLFALLGWWLDGWFNTKPMMILICSLLGVAVAMYSFFRTISNLEKRKKQKSE